MQRKYYLLWDVPLGISFLDTENTVLPLRVAKSGFNNTFVDYSSKDNLSENLGDESSLNPSILDLYGYIPDTLINVFLLLSTNQSRQVFADNLSTMSLLWIIAHEDAHKYSGHLKHFHELGISEQDRLFEELISTVDNKQDVNERRSAELEADTCATMRAVDYYFESEFLGMFTDYLSLDTKEQIWQEHREYVGLGESQRLFLMRLISISSILSLAVFECALASSSSSNLSCYPTFVTRALNVIFTVASRAMDVSLRRADENRVGQIDLSEFQSFFSLAVDDFLTIYTIISNCISSHASNRLSPLLSNRQSLVTSLLVSFFACHGQAPLLGLRRKIKREDFGDENQMIVSFIRERHLMYRNCVEIFAKAKKIVNSSRLDKVDQDINIALERVNIAQDVFEFL